MQAKLARALIQKGVIQRGTILEAYYSVRSLSGQYDTALPTPFKLIGAQAVGDWVYFNAVGPDDAECRIRCDYVTGLDGMPVARVAESHLLTEAGEPVASKRGRTVPLVDGS